MTRVPAALIVATLIAAPASARPDLRQSRAAGPLTVYADDARRGLFYYPPGELAIASEADGSPAVRLLHARYTGSVVTRDQGTALVRSILTIGVQLDAPRPAQIAEAVRALTAGMPGPVELRPLPIRRVESEVLYAPVTPDPPDPQPLPAGHYEAAAAVPAVGYWRERIYTLRLAAADAQLLSTALDRGQVALSISYAFVAEGIGPDPARPTTHVVRAGAVSVTADARRWPRLVSRVDINDAAPPGYAALDIYCYDFNGETAASELYEKTVEIEAAGVGGRPVTIARTFSRAQPDIVAQAVRFPVAVRLDRPYRYRVIATATDGTAMTSPWREQPLWTALLDVTTQGDHR